MRAKFAQDSIGGPSGTAPLNQSRWWDADFLSPFHQRLRAAVKGQSHVAAVVQGLLLRRRPAAILLAIGAGIVHTIQRSALWPWPHILEKRCKTGAPTVADRNATPTVICVGLIIRIVAPLFHRIPEVVFRSMMQAVRRHQSGRDFPMQAATTARPISERLATDNLFGAAIASAYPPWAPSWSNGCGRDDEQATEALADSIDASHIGADYIANTKYLGMCVRDYATMRA